METTQIYFKIDIEESNRTSKVIELSELISSVVRSKYNDRHIFNYELSVPLNEDEDRRIRDLFLKTYTKNNYKIKDVIIDSVSLFAKKPEPHKPANWWWVIKGVASTEIYKCFSIINGITFVCEDPQTNEIIQLHKDQNTTVFVVPK